MSVEIRGKSDACLKAIAKALKPFVKKHPKAEAVIYRHNSVAVRLRIIDPDFGPMSWADRHDYVWGYLEELPEDVLSEMSVLLLLSPEETATSFGNVDFEHPIPSEL